MNPTTAFTKHHQETWAGPFVIKNNWRQLVYWTLTLIIATFGFRYAVQLMPYVMDKLYELLILKNIAGF